MAQPTHRQSRGTSSSSDWGRSGSFRRPFEVAEFDGSSSKSGRILFLLWSVRLCARGGADAAHARDACHFGATAWIPTVQALAFFVEIGPLVTGLLVAGRVGSGIGAVLSNMRATEQIDAIESLSVDSFKFLVVPRIVA